VEASVDELAEAEVDVAAEARERIAERLRDRCDGRIDDASVGFERVAEAVVVIGHEPAGVVRAMKCS
jgi:hypothetical protein